ncbi:hypothetical protein, partial [Dyella sp.]|uniref:hypothetical protein n=1 Tax=Dyella sp. TaxID=1869338 RepID=UPI002ED56881
MNSHRRMQILRATPVSSKSTNRIRTYRHPLCFKQGLLAAALLGSWGQATSAQNITLGQYNPQLNDNEIGATVVAPGATVNLGGPQQFLSGDSGARNTTLGALLSINRITTGAQWIGAERLNPGTQNYGVTVPDPITGGTRVTSTYATANLMPLTAVTEATTVPDDVDVNGAQYIDMRVGTVNQGGGTINVNIGGGAGSLSTAASNAWTIAAKQSSLFYADGSGGNTSSINWNANNRISFIGDVAPTTAQSYSVTYVSTYGGTFSVTTTDGIVSTHTVNNDADLRTYNDWLITQLQSGNLDPTQYNANFSKAYSSATQSIGYTASATSPDEVTLPIGDRIVLHLVGAQATGTIAAGATLEVSNANNGAIRAEAGAQAINNGTLATINTAGSGTALYLTGNGTSGQNNGVINGNVFLAPNGSATNSAYGSNVVDLFDNATFSNTGVLNLATGATNGAGASAGIRLNAGTRASSSGIINVGVTGSRSNGSMTGVLLNDPTASFTNTIDGLIYIGRGPQTRTSSNPADVAINQGSLTAGITVNGNATALNEGTITLGTKTQNAAGIVVNNGINANVVNSGTININGAAATVPRESDGILVTNAGGVSNTGDINLNGVNGVGIKVLSTNATASQATSTGSINVAGGADPGSGTRNFGVWVEGQGSGTATAAIGGAINLLGNGAIGIHARGRATIDVEASAIPAFANGSKQIAFFAYGPNAQINVASSALDVTTTGSTLFRVENGANFDGTGLTLTSSGQGSLAVLGTGAPSSISTQNANINVSGAGATGVMVEGGATGLIDAGTVMQLTGDSAVAGIVDGQKHSLTGASSGAPVASTSLASAATLTSDQSNLIGYIARNQATFTNSGDIDFHGAHATGISVQSGSTGTNSGNITVADGGVGMAVDSSATNTTTTANNTGTVVVDSGSVADRTRGIVATGAKATANLQAGAQVQLNGVGAIGAEAINGATIHLSSGATPVFDNTDQIAFHAQGSGASIISAAGSLDASTDRSSIYRIDDGATLSLSGSPMLSASGAGAHAIDGSGAGSTVITGNATFDISGDGAVGVQMDGGSSGTISAGTSVQVSGAGIGGVVDGQRTGIDGTTLGSPVATTLVNQGSVSGSAEGATGFIARNLGTLVNNTAVTMSGTGSTGVLLQDGGTLTNNAMLHVADGVGIQVEGADSHILGLGTTTVDNGMAGIRLLDGAQTVLDGQGGNLVTHGSAHGILLDTDASSLMASHATITTDGSGNGIENAAEIADVSLSDLTIHSGDGAGIRTATAFDPSSTVTMNVDGGGTGLAFRHADGSVASGDLVLGTGYVVHALGAGASGIQALTTGHVTTAAHVDIDSTAGGAALIAGTAASTIQSGELTSVSSRAPVVDLANGNGTVFTNQGTIQAVSATGIALRGSAGNDTLNLISGSVRGDIATGDGSDTFQWTAGTLEGSLSMGNGANNTATVQHVDLGQTLHLTAGTGGGNTLNLNAIASRGGSFTTDDLSRGVNLGTGWNTINFNDGTAFTLTDNLKLANSDVNIDASSTLFTGDEVYPTISGATPTSARVTNAGLIDLTQGTGSPGNRLTIAGDYVSQGGQVNMVSTLNFGGALADQFTDRLLIQGNASEPGGSTVLHITPSAVSTGELTDFNHNSAVDANEGISVVQVAGTSSADMFRLAGGFVEVGPWQYGLYAFAPGASDAAQRVVTGNDNAFWDYRLANVYRCETDCIAPTQSNPPPTPPPGAPANPPLPPADDTTTLAPAPLALPDDGCVVDGIDNCAPGRRAVAPQVPTYISAPVALASYGWEMLDNLHKRLGEVRHENALDPGTAGEAFARFIGGDYTYNTDRSFRQYGYNYDEDIRALQIGVNILDIDSDKSAFRGGVAYTHGITRVDPRAADGYSRSKYYSNSIAAFLTWQDSSGFYVDAVVSGDRHQGDVDTQGRQSIGRLRATGWTASLET